MSDWTREEVTTTRIVYRVPAGNWQPLRQALHAIVRELGDRASSYDDAVQVDTSEIMGDRYIELSWQKPVEPPF